MSAGAMMLSFTFVNSVHLASENETLYNSVSIFCLLGIYLSSIKYLSSVVIASKQAVSWLLTPVVLWNMHDIVTNDMTIQLLMLWSYAPVYKQQWILIY